MKGFTLIELIVVMAIMGVLTGLMFANYGAGRKSIASRQSVQNIAQSIRAMQNKSLGGECASSPCRFGVHFDISATSFLTFEDSGASLNGQYDPGEEIESIALEDNILITALSASSTCGTSLCADVLFAPPDPVVSFMPVSASELVISITDGKSVVVGSGGSIDIN